MTWMLVSVAAGPMLIAATDLTGVAALVAACTGLVAGAAGWWRSRRTDAIARDVSYVDANLRSMAEANAFIAADNVRLRARVAELEKRDVERERECGELRRRLEQIERGDS